MKSHHNYVFIQIFIHDICFIYNVIFILKTAADLYERSSLRVSSAVGAYWNPCVAAYGLVFLHVIGFSLQYHNIPQILFLQPHGFLSFTEKNIKKIIKPPTQDVVVYERFQISLFTKNVFE